MFQQPTLDTSDVAGCSRWCRRRAVAARSARHVRNRYAPRFPVVQAKHQAASVKHAIMGTGQVLTTNSPSSVMGGFQILTRTAGASLPGDLVDINGTAINSFTSTNTKNTSSVSGVVMWLCRRCVHYSA